MDLPPVGWRRALDFIQRQGLRHILEEGDTLFVPAGGRMLLRGASANLGRW